MRFDTPVYFRSIKRGEYNAATGDYLPDTPVEVRRMASVTSTGKTTVQLIYGAMQQGSFTVRLQRPYKEPFDDIRIGEKLYKVDMSRPLRTKMAFVVHEVQGNGQN